MSSPFDNKSTARSIQELRKLFYSRQHFPKFLLGIMAFSGVAGYQSIKLYMETKMERQRQIYEEAYYNHPETQSERLMALTSRLTRRLTNNLSQPSTIQRQVTKFW
mmetsp:Transcript_12334/g.28104  ORF Transcript_12334/g.28104 Transcript_12334/m.28104 type:complete len:106 (-) Transcript_12334:609-926(-)